MLLLVFLMSSGCSEQPPDIPVKPEMLQTMQELEFSTYVTSTDSSLWNAVWDTAEQKYGRPGMWLSMFRLDTNSSVNLLFDHYRQQLSNAGGWITNGYLSNIRSPLGSIATFEKNEFFFAITVLDQHYAEGGFIPVTVISNIPAPWGKKANRYGY